jgi:thiamine-phosphate pyrophosphorylase
MASSNNDVAFRIILITDGFDSETTGRVARALGELPRGLAAVQLRAKDLGGRALFDAAVALRAITREAGARLLVNDRADVALAAGADGVHLPARGLPPKYAKRAIDKAGGALIVGASTHAREEAVMAARGGADYLIFGPIWDTPSKARYGEPQGLARLAEVVPAVDVPVFAVGGIDRQRAAECVRAGARVAVIGAVLGSGDPAAGARAIAASMERA